jgi:hypothetical protein
MVYLLCFDQKFKHAKHYIGFAESSESFEKRLKHHRSGSGARLMSVISKAGIGFQVARTWPTGDRTFERKLKNRKNSSKLCPFCKADAVIEKADAVRTEIKEIAPIVCPVVEQARGFAAPSLPVEFITIPAKTPAEVVKKVEEIHDWINQSMALPFEPTNATVRPLEAIRNLKEICDAQPKSPASISRWQGVWNSLASFFRLREIYRLFKR